MKSILSPTLCLVALWALTSLSALAQPTSGGPAPSSPAAIGTPLDGGASLLLAGGVAFGLKQLRARRLARRSAK